MALTYSARPPVAEQLRLPVGRTAAGASNETVDGLVAALDDIAEQRQLRRISREASLVLVREVFTGELEETRCAVARTSASLLHVLEVFTADPSPSVRAASAYNKNAIDQRIQLRLAADATPMVVLSLLDAVSPGWETVEWLATHSPFEVVRLDLATRRLTRPLLLRLAADASPAVAAAARANLAGSRRLQSVA